MNILLVNHDRTSRTLLRATLAVAPQHRLTVADDEDSAWRTLNETEGGFDVVLLDFRPAEPGSYELLRKIRHAAWQRPLSLIICSTAHDPALMLEVAQLGVRHFLPKPCPRRVLLATLRQIESAHSYFDWSPIVQTA